MTGQGTAADTAKTVLINIEKGEVKTATIDGESATIEDGYAIVDKLPVGTYTVAEQLSDEQTGRKIALVGENNVTVTVSTAPGTEIPTQVFVNNKTALGDLKIKKSVTLNGGITDTTLVDGTYTFTVTGLDLVSDVKKTVAIGIENGKVKNATVDGTAVTPDNGYATVKDLPIGFYKIVETISDEMTAKGIVLADPSGNEITVEVTENNVNGIPEADFTNNKDIGELEIKKDVEGTADKTKEFAFEVKLTAPANVILESSYPAIITDKDNNASDTMVEVAADGTVTTEIILKANESLKIKELPAGTGYTVEESTEKNPSGYTKKSEYETSGTIEAASTSTAAFVNEYHTKGEITFSGKKELKNRVLKEGEFEFELYDSEGKLKETAKNAVDGSYSFTKIEYTGNDLATDSEGNFVTTTKTYKVKEKLGKDTAVTYSPKEYKITVTLADDSEGHIDTTADPKENTYDFENIYESEGQIQFFAKKSLVRRDLKEGEFSFKLTGPNGYEQIKPNAADGTVTFDPIDYDQDDLVDGLAEFNYTISEVKPTDPTVIYDATEHPITVSLEDNWDGTITAVATPDATNKDEIVITFTNIVTKIEKLGNTPKSDDLISVKDAHLQVLNGNTVIDEWDTNGEPHEVENLAINTEYTLRESVVAKYPDSDPARYYTFADDTTFTVDEDGEITYSSGLELRSEDGTLLLKDKLATQPEFKKKIQDTNDTTGETSEWQDSADYDIGDAVPYKLWAKLADNVTDYPTYHITFHDEMEEGLTFKGIDRVTVKGVEVKADDYELTSDDHSFDLKLTWEGDATKGLNSAEVEVYFTAELNTKAVRGNEGNVNKGRLEYSCNPNVGQGGETEHTEWDSVICFTYDGVINKVDKDGKALTGAQFELEKKLADNSFELINRLTVKDDSTFTFNGLDDGEYRLTETYVPTGMKAIDPISFTVTADHTTVWEGESRTTILKTLTGDEKTGALKLEADEKTLSALVGDIKNEEAKKPEFEKKIKDTNDTTGKTSDWQDSADYDIGDAVPYRLTAKLADNVTDYKNYHITFNDVMEKGLTFNGIKLVMVNGSKVTDYELTSDEHSFALTLTWKGENGEKIAADKKLNGAQVEVHFNAILNEDANLGSMGNVNTAYLAYSCNSNVDENGDLEEGHEKEEKERKTEEDSVIAFTYKTVVNKVDEDGNPLTGASFELYKQIKDSDPVLVKCVTAESGDVFTFNGLDDGTYVLKETGHPNGYKPIDDITFEVKAEHKDTWETEERTQILTALTGDNLELGELPAEEVTFEADEAYSTLTANIKNETELTSVTVKKVWDDDDNRDGKRPDKLVVKLLANGEEKGTYTLTAEGNWMKRVDGLAKMKNGKQVLYTWSEEVPEGYTLTNITGNTLGAVLTTLTNSYGPEKVEIKVRKVWDDNNDLAKKRPESVTVQLYADGEAVETAKLDASNEWSCSWTELKMCKDANGSREIVYTVAELDIPEDYICTITSDGEKSFVIKNTYDTGKLVIEKEFDIEPWEPFGPDDSPMDIPVIKTWNDNDNKDGNRPAAITVRLYADGEEIANAQLKEETNWRYTFTGLPRLTEEKEKIVYTITEDAVEWYESEINGFNIRNNYKPELTSVTVKKVWDDNNNAAGKRPNSIAMTLSNGMVVVLDATNSWTATISDLPTKVNGQPVTYTWKEQQVLNYTKTDEVTADGVTTFTNRYYATNPATTTRKTNTPTHSKPKEELEDYKTPLGVNVMINHVGDCFD